MSDSKKEHPRVQVHNVSLEKLEKAVYSRDHEKASELLLDGLRKLKAGAEFIGYQTNPDMKMVLYTRFCAAIISLLADPEYHLSQEGFEAFSSEHAIIDVMFRASVFGTSDHLLPQMAVDPTERDSDKIKFQDSVGLTKYMMTHSLRSGFMMNFEEAFKKSPQITFPLYIGMLTTMHVCNQAAEDRKEMLLGLAEIFESVELTDRLVSPMSDAYMYCSYGHRSDKHNFKGMIHRLYAKLMVAHGYVPQEFNPRAAKKKKPTMVVPLEWFTSLHAMYRCYAPVLRQLRTKFKLVGIGRPHAIDEESVKEFDKWITVPEDKVALSEIIKDVRSVEPDVIYYPSLGMDLIWVALSSVRLAPIQLMTLGHPASSFSPAMDYVICEEADVADPSLFSETLVPLPEGALFRFVMRVDADIPTAIPQTLDPPVVKLAIPAMMLKLNATFIRTLQEIQRKSERKVEFHFWPNMIGSNLYQAAKEIREMLPGAFTYERSAYNHYMRQLQGCHIQLGTFPFGGTNSNIDCMHLGLPLVCMVGKEPHSTVDATMSKRVGLPDWLRAHTLGEYIDAAVRLINNDEERVALSNYLINDADIDSKFFGKCPSGLETAIVDAVWKIYREH